jgi:hypothetical protein
MSYHKVNSSFLNRHFIYKFILIISSIFAVINLNINGIIILYLATCLFFVNKMEILRSWLKSMLILIPFFISLLLAGYFLKIDYYQQIYLLMKICYIILMSVYLVKSIDLTYKLQLLNIKKRNLGEEIQLFFYSTLKFTNLLFNHFNSLSLKKNRISDFLKNTIDLHHEGNFTTEFDSEQDYPKKSELEKNILKEDLLIIVLISFIIILFLVLK